MEKHYSPEELQNIFEIALQKNEANRDKEFFRKAAQELGLSEAELRNAEAIYLQKKQIAEEQARKRRAKRGKIIFTAILLGLPLAIFIYNLIPQSPYEGDTRMFIRKGESFNDKAIESDTVIYALTSSRLYACLMLLEPKYTKYPIKFSVFKPNGQKYISERSWEREEVIAYTYENETKGCYYMDLYLPVEPEYFGKWKIEAVVGKKTHTEFIQILPAIPDIEVSLKPRNASWQTRDFVTKSVFDLTEIQNKDFILEADAIFKLSKPARFIIECKNEKGEIITSNARNTETSNQKFILNLPLTQL